jgi:hypothetical protein
MSSTNNEVTISFPEDFDAREEFEMTFRGYLADVMVRLPDGGIYKLTFIDVTRLGQTLEDDTALGRPYYAEPGLVVLPEVTRGAIQRAIDGLRHDAYFQHLKPVKGSDPSMNAGNTKARP